MMMFRTKQRFPLISRHVINLFAVCLVLLSLLSVRTIPVNGAQPVCSLTAIRKGTPPGPVISGDSNMVIYSWGEIFPGPGLASQVYAYNRLTDQTLQASLSYEGKSYYFADEYNTRPAVSDDGHLIVFFSNAANLVPDYDETIYQLYIRNTLLATTEMVTVSSDEVPSNTASWTPAVSSDARFVAFQSNADNLVTGDTNGSMDTFLRDRQLGTTERVSIATDGSQGDFLDDYGYSSIDISADGRYVVFYHENLKGMDGVPHAGIFLRDRQQNETYWIVEGFFPAMTPDARFIVFLSREQLHPDDESLSDDLYVYDRENDEFQLISAGLTGKSEGVQYYFYNFPSISADGNLIAYGTNNPNLVENDTNEEMDVFIHDRRYGTNRLLSMNMQGEEGNSRSTNPSISNDGQFIAFYSNATNLLESIDEPDYIYLCRLSGPLFNVDTILFMPFITR